MKDFNVILAKLTPMARDGSKYKLSMVKLVALIIIQVHNKNIYESPFSYEVLTMNSSNLLVPNN